MNAAFAMAFALLALGYLSLLAHLRQIRQRQVMAERLSRSLELALMSGVFAEAVLPQERLLGRAR